MNSLVLPLWRPSNFQHHAVRIVHRLVGTAWQHSCVTTGVTISELQSTHDAALVERMSRGDQKAAATLYDQYSAMLFALALRFVGQQADAEEVVLETFMHAWRHAGQFEASRATVAGWLTMLTRTRAIDRLRSEGRHARLADVAGQEVVNAANTAAHLLAADAQLEQSEEGEVISRALQGLPEQQRDVIHLAFYQGLTHSEIAERLGQPLGTVKTRIRLGVTRLRDVLASRFGERVT